LIEKAETVFEEKEAEAAAQKLMDGQFTFDDFLEQMQQVKKMGSMSSIMQMLPSMGMPRVKEEDVDESALVRMEAILDSMTIREREHPQLINGSRKKRIAKGSGTTVQEINRLLKQYLAMKKMMKRFSKGFGGRKLGKMGKGMKGLPPELFG
ncbi:MAG: signal recognition particle protein, partial [Acidobacteria bacterium]|nr:signal recognition particle protein [Acidobacteriota bacterium]